MTKRHNITTDRKISIGAIVAFEKIVGNNIMKTINTVKPLL